MSDPYKILGVTPKSTDDEIKAAYLELAKKYHPDNYDGGPLAQIANEKTQEINNAYDTIMNERRNSTVNIGNKSRKSYENSSSDFADVRTLINSNRLVEAEELLDDVSETSRNGEWHFLKGTIFFSRGWLEDAATYWESATNLEPNNMEYRAAYNRVMWQRKGNFGGSPQGQYNNPQRSTQCGVCDICAGLMCADMCCGCLGGRSCCC